MIPIDLSALANHLWQSTLSVVAVWLLALALKKNRAEIRYQLWLAASLKFLVPFSLLVSIGARLPWRLSPVAAPPEFSGVFDEISRPFSPADGASSLAITRTAGINFSMIAIGVWLLGIAVGLIFWLRWWRQIRAVRRTATPLAFNLPIPTLSSPARLDPGVFGIFRPVLILPEGITERLTPAQLETVLAHELCHIRRMDNLTAAIHMLVESIFWFHPLVWWIRTRLVAERESACDEAVVGGAGDPRVYAEAILNVCKLYAESPLACVSGVTGASLKRRIEAIMGNHAGRQLGRAKKLLLAGAGAAALVGPIVIGAGHAPPLLAQSKTQTEFHKKFDVASVRLVDHPVPFHPYALNINHGTVKIDAVPLLDIVGMAYQAQPVRMQGGPRWINSERYDIQAKTENQNATRDEIREMLQALLADRFQLAFHRETKQLPTYSLVVGKDGPKFKAARDDEQTNIARNADGEPVLHVTFQKWSMAGLANTLTGPAGSPVRDRTGLTGTYDFELEWAPDDAAGFGPSIFTAVQDQLGLRLEASKGPVEIMVIDHVEHATQN